MSLKASWQQYTLQFTFDAGTSRGVMRTRDTWVIRLWDAHHPGVSGYGEAGPLPGLSIDHRPDIGDTLDRVLKLLEGMAPPATPEEVYRLVQDLVPAEWPSIRFAVETALLDLVNGGSRIIIDKGVGKDTRIPINGLIWMGDKPFMLQQMESKLAAGFSCLKMKIGAIESRQEEQVLGAIRERRKARELTLRVDANGAFTPENALDHLHRLAAYDLHSIEQPIKPGQPEAMRKLCENSPLPIALDEELIGLHTTEQRAMLLERIRPFGIVLKPGLVGGLASTLEWIRLAEERDIAWWVTSALESNIGLNAIAQLTASLDPTMHQGLGTGQLYHNNFPSPMVIKQGSLQYDSGQPWDLSQLSV
ncbi:MAG: o-succinylbenzoate synthase [Cyclobacteriaceae bacterium]